MIDLQILMDAMIFADPVSVGLLVATVGSSLFAANEQSKAADESEDQARTEKRRVAFQKLQEDRKILRETSRSRAAGIQNAANVGVNTQSSAVQGGAATATQAGAVGLGANAANFGFFNKIQDSKIREAGFLGQAQTFQSVSSIFGSALQFRQEAQKQAVGAG